MSVLMKKNIIQTIIILTAVLAIDIIAALDLIKMHHPDKLYPSDGLSEIQYLSNYNSRLKGGNGDTEIYVFDSGKPGASILLLGGTHPNEPASFLTAALVLENIQVSTGRIFVIPRACNSGFTCTDPFEGCPEYYHIQSKYGERRFRFGSRVSNPLDQWPDPLVYSHFPSGQKLSGFETRNLNRAYPGRENGSFTEKVAYAIMELLKKEKITLAFDLHEAAPEIPIINAIVYHEKCEELALMAVMNLEMKGLNYAPELSPINFHGLSHREWGDYTDAYPFLMETSNPIQGRLRGKTNEDLIRYGKSIQYQQAQETGALRIVYKADTGEPLERRVGRHLQGFKEIISVYNETADTGQMFEFSGLPEYDEIMTNGLKEYFQ